MRILTSGTVAVTIAVLSLSSLPQRAAGQDVPEFIEVGKQYLFGAFGMDDPAVGEVLGIGRGAWIQVKIAELEQPIWINLDVVAVVVEMTEELQGNMASSRDQAYQAMMRADLRNLVTAEESYFADNLKYATLAELDDWYTPSTGVTIAVSDVSDNGWSAMAWHELSDVICYIYVGNAEPPVPGMSEGAPLCR